VNTRPASFCHVLRHTPVLFASFLLSGGGMACWATGGLHAPSPSSQRSARAPSSLPVEDRKKALTEQVQKSEAQGLSNPHAEAYQSQVQAEQAALGKVREGFKRAGGQDLSDQEFVEAVARGDHFKASDSVLDPQTKDLAFKGASRHLSQEAERSYLASQQNWEKEVGIRKAPEEALKAFNDSYNLAGKHQQIKSKYAEKQKTIDQEYQEQKKQIESAREARIKIYETSADLASAASDLGDNTASWLEGLDQSPEGKQKQAEKEAERTAKKQAAAQERQDRVKGIHEESERALKEAMDQKIQKGVELSRQKEQEKRELSDRFAEAVKPLQDAFEGDYAAMTTRHAQQTQDLEDSLRARRGEATSPSQEPLDEEAQGTPGDLSSQDTLSSKALPTEGVEAMTPQDKGSDSDGPTTRSVSVDTRDEKAAATGATPDTSPNGRPSQSAQATGSGSKTLGSSNSAPKAAAGSSSAPRLSQDKLEGFYNAQRTMGEFVNNAGDIFKYNAGKTLGFQQGNPEAAPPKPSSKPSSAKDTSSPKPVSEPPPSVEPVEIVEPF